MSWEQSVRAAVASLPRPLQALSERVSGSLSRGWGEVIEWTVGRPGQTPHRWAFGNEPRFELHGAVEEARCVAAAWAPGASLEDLGALGPLDLVRTLFAEAPHSADVVAVAVPRSVARLVTGRGAFVLPQSVEGIVRLDGAWDQVAVWPHARRYGRKVRSRFRVEVQTGAAALGRFYEELYRPYLETRFGSAQSMRPRSFFERFGVLGEVMAVIDGSQWVAGGFNVRHADRYRLLALAQRSVDSLKAGAGHAYYLSSLERAHALGYGIADLGPDRPFLCATELTYKRGWGVRLTENRFATRSLVVRIGNWGSSVSDAMAACPVAVVRDGRVHGLAVAPSGARAEDVTAALTDRYADLGLAGFDVISPGRSS